jgi:tetratricopeptide (TPR) repeat protein
MAHQQAETGFVGRDRELRALEASLEASRLGRGGLVLLGGEPGIGKSRLADELARRARDQGHLVLWGRGWEDAGAPPYWPWVQALRAYLRFAASDDVRDHLGSGATDIAQMLPELRDRFPDLAPPREQGSEAARFQLFDSTATLLRNVARERPVLVVIDDLQAADTPSIRLLGFLASQLGDMPVLVVGTYRDVELTPEHPLTAALAELAREPSTRIISVPGLGSEAVAEYIRVTTDRAPRDPLAAAIWRATGGNPLFIREAVRLLSAEGRLGDVADLPSLRVAVPAGVRAVIARRIGHLGREIADLLTLGAVIGPEFGIEVLRLVADIDGRRAIELAEEAVQAGLLQVVVGAPARYRFSHDLVRETLYDEISPGRRAGIHRRIGDVLEARHADTGSGHLAELAFHFVQAVQQGPETAPEASAERLDRKAIDYATRAAEAAAGSLAFEESARLCRLALGVLDAIDERDDETRTAILLLLGDAQSRAGSLTEAQATFWEAAEIARRTGDGSRLAQAALGSGGRHYWARPGNDARLIPLLQDALVLLGGGDEPLRVRLLTRLACAWRSTPERRDDSAALSRQAVEIARRLGDPATLTYALTGRFWATWWPENPSERQSIAEEMMGIAAALGDGERIADAHFMAFLTLIERGRISEARNALATLSRVVEELRQPPHLWLEPTNRAELALLSGDFSGAESFIGREVTSDYRFTPARDNVSAARMHRFLLRREQDRVAEEEASTRASCEDFPWYPFHRAALACLLLDTGRKTEAREVFEALAWDNFRAIYRDNEWLLGMALASEACALLGHAGPAAHLYEQLQPFAGRHAIGHSEGSVGAIDRYLGLLAGTLQDLDSAVRHLEAAVAANSRMGARPWAAHSQHDLATVLRRRAGQGDRARAEQLDRAARATAIDLGMSLAGHIEVAVATSPPASTAPASSSAAFQLEGEYRSIAFGGETFRVRDSKGMQHLARLLGQPGREMHALELASAGAIASAEAVTGESRGRAGEAALKTNRAGDAGPILDPEAKAAYRERLRDIREDLAEAERWNDPERVRRLEAEAEALTQELAHAVGFGGRDRPGASAAERARVSVTRAIRAAMLRIQEHSPSLGGHLDATIRTGTYCSYVPDPRTPIDWRT